MKRNGRWRRVVHRPVVTNAPQAFAPEDSIDDLNSQSPFRDGVDLADSPSQEGSHQAGDDDQGSGEESTKGELKSIDQAIEPGPAMGQQDRSALEYSVGGLTMSRFSMNAGPDPQVMSMIMQHTQMKSSDKTSKRISSQVNSIHRKR